MSSLPRGHISTLHCILTQTQCMNLKTKCYMYSGFFILLLLGLLLKIGNYHHFITRQLACWFTLLTTQEQFNRLPTRFSLQFMVTRQLGFNYTKSRYSWSPGGRTEHVSPSLGQNYQSKHNDTNETVISECQHDPNLIVKIQNKALTPSPCKHLLCGSISMLALLCGSKNQC